MKTVIIDLPETAIIGKEGLCTKENNVVQSLWQEANSHFSEVASLGKKNTDGNYIGFWGAMSDESLSFKPWTEGFSRGLYLAGIEVNPDATAPDGWTKWILPERKYLVCDVMPDTYASVFNEVINHILPDSKLKLSGAVCDFTNPVSGQNYLYFPVENI